MKCGLASHILISNFKKTEEESEQFGVPRVWSTWSLECLELGKCLEFFSITEYSLKKNNRRKEVT